MSSRVLRVAAVSLLIAAGSISTARADDGRCPESLEPDADDDALYNAGVCFEERGSIGAALRVYEELMRRYPRSSHAARSMIRAGALYEAIIFFDKAARLFADYSKRYAGERDAPHALRRSIRLYAATGNDRAALAGVARFVKMFGRKRAGDAAEVFFAAAAIHREVGEEALEAHLRSYLRRFGARGGRDRAAIAHATLGEILWRRSCRLGARGVRGTCRALARSRRRRPACGKSIANTRRVTRDAALAREARSHLSRAVKMYRPPARPTSAREIAASEWRTLAELTLLEQDLEAHIDDTFPRGLDFDPKRRALKERSVERFTRWLQRMQKNAATLRQRYTEIARRPGRHASHAAYRVAQLMLHLREQLLGSEIPRNVRTGPHAAELKKIYCEALGDHSAPLERASVTTLEYCVRLPGWGPRSAMCAAELVKLAPETHPPARERHGTATHAGPVLDTAGAVQ